MRTLLLCLCMFGLTVGANGQGDIASPIQVRPSAAFLTASQVLQVRSARTLPSGQVEYYSAFLAKNVEIHIGSVVLTADEAEFPNSAVNGSGEPGDVQLRGIVNLKGPLEVARTVIHGDSK